MKPSPFTQPQSVPRLFGLLLVTILVGCAGGTPQVLGDDDDQPPPPMIKQPPTPKDGSSTTAGCDGITEAGTCQDGKAVYCDIEAATLRTKDCAALGKSCVLDPSSGAKCETVTPGGGGESSCESGVTNEGFCGGTGNQTATWCDEFSGETIAWNCQTDGLSCRTDCTTSGGTAIPGAFCCGAAGAPTANECPALGFEGECNGTTEARWCNGDQLIEQQCTGGKTCVIDPVIGAICRLPELSECDQLGFEGRCVAGKPRWCSGGEIMEVTCSVGTQCQEDGCDGAGGVEGAYCCSP